MIPFGANVPEDNKKQRQRLPRFYTLLSRGQLRKGLPFFLMYGWSNKAFYKALFLEVAEQLGLKLFGREGEGKKGGGKEKSHLVWKISG